MMKGLRFATAFSTSNAKLCVFVCVRLCLCVFVCECATRRDRR